MFNYYTQLIRRFFKLKVYHKKWLAHLFVSAFLRTLSYLTVPYIASCIVDNATSGNYQEATKQAILFFVGAGFYILCHHYNHWAYYKNANYIHNCLQRKILHKVASFDEGFAENISPATVINTSYADISENMRIPDFFFDLLATAAGIVVDSIILIITSPLIGLLTAALSIISVRLFTYHMKRRDYYDTFQRTHQDSISGLYSQMIDGHDEVHSFNMKKDLSTLLQKDVTLWRKAYLKKRFHQDMADTIIPAFLGVGRLIIYLVATSQILSGNFTIATLVLIIGYFEDIQDNYVDFTSVVYKLSKCSVSINRMHSLLNYKNKHMQQFGDNDTDDIAGRISFRGVKFSYKGKTAMHEMNFDIEPRTFTAIVGKSGSGKSTIFRLLLRLYKPTRGQILLDDVNINDYSRKVYASNVSIVTQKPFIFDMTIRENLSLVDSNIEHQIEACKIAGIHNDIMKLPQKYNTKLIGDASNLSAGQKQLLSLARTLLSRSEVLLFDEVTSSLDPESSQTIANVLKKLKDDHTVIMVTHKPELMKLADEIFVIDHGHLVGQGTHEKLIKRNPYYKALHDMV